MKEYYYPKQLLTQKEKIKQNQCFFVMPFMDEYINLYETLSLYLSRENYTCLRDDQNNLASIPIINLILSGLGSSQYIIADISCENPNVFYELGIAHTIKSFENVFLIKEKSANIPFDIQHLQCIEYDKNNIKALANDLITRLESKQYINMLKQSLKNNLFIIDDEVDNFVDCLCKVFEKKQIDIFVNILDNEINYSDSQEVVSNIFSFEEKLHKEIITKELSSSNLNFFIELFICLLVKCSSFEKIVLFVEEFLEKKEYKGMQDEELISFQTDIALAFAKKDLLPNIMLNWIIDYFQRSKSTKVDLNRYKLEAFLLKSNSIFVNQYISNAIVAENRYIREHLSDIVGEKKLYIAEENLLIQLKREENVYAVASIMEALGKLNSKTASKEIRKWIDNHKSNLINKDNLFVIKHARNAILNCGSEEDKEQFDKSYLTLISGLI